MTHFVKRILKHFRFFCCNKFYLSLRQSTTLSSKFAVINFLLIYKKKSVKFLYQTVKLQPQLRLEQTTIQQESLHKNNNVDILFALTFLIFTTQINASI